MSQPRPARRPHRRPASPGAIILATVRGDRTRAPVPAASVQEHPREDRQVVGRAEQPRVPGIPAHPARRRVVDDAAQHRRAGVCRARPAARTTRSARCGCCSDAGGRNVVSRMPSGPKTRAFRNASQRLLRDALDDVAEQEEVDVRVDEALAGGGDRHFLDGAANRFGAALERHVQIEVGPQPGRMRQQMADRDPILAIALEPRHVVRHAIGQAASGRPRPAASPPSSSPRLSSATRGRRSCRRSSARRRAQPRDCRTRACRASGLPRPATTTAPGISRRAMASVDERLDQRESRRIETGPGGWRGSRAPEPCAATDRHAANTPGERANRARNTSVSLPEHQFSVVCARIRLLVAWLKKSTQALADAIELRTPARCRAWCRWPPRR